jgi:TRAP-type transport system periplasmic protein
MDMLRLDRRAFNLSPLATGASALAARALTGRAAAARPVLIASLLGENKPETKIWLKISDFIEAKLPGHFSFNIVPNAALGGEKDVNDGLRLGAIQGSLNTLSALSAWAPESQLFDMPFLFRDDDHVRATVASKPGAALKAKPKGRGSLLETMSTTARGICLPRNH